MVGSSPSPGWSFSAGGSVWHPVCPLWKGAQEMGEVTFCAPFWGRNVTEWGNWGGSGVGHEPQAGALHVWTVPSLLHTPLGWNCSYFKVKTWHNQLKSSIKPHSYSWYSLSKIPFSKLWLSMYTSYIHGGFLLPFSVPR